MSLSLMTFSSEVFGTIRCFSTASKAVRHLDAHVLSAPECEGWMLLIPDYESIVHDRFQYAKALMRHPERGSDLYQQYADIIRRALRDAGQLNWYTQPEEGDLVALGLEGVAVYIHVEDDTHRDHVVKTAYLPRWGNPGEVDREDEPPLSREHSRSDDDGPWSRASGRHHRDNWSRTQRIFYDVFRKARRAVRTTHYTPSPPREEAEEPRGELGLLLDPLRDSLNEAESHVGTSSDANTQPDRHSNFRAWRHLLDQVR